MEKTTLLMLMIFAVVSVMVRGSEENDDDQLLNLSKLEMFVDELPEMSKINGFAVDDKGTLVPGNLTIGMYEIKWKFHRDLPATRVFAYGTSRSTATVPGPTIEAIQGVPTYVTWSNHLPSRHILPWDPTILIAGADLLPRQGGVPTVVHLHGGVHPPFSDGNPNSWFTSSFRHKGRAWSTPTYYYPNVQDPGSLWYHDHAMGLTRVNLLAGLVGTYNIRSLVTESVLHLPPDRNLVIFDRSFRTDGSIYMNGTGNNPKIHPQWQPEYFGDAIIVNGKAWPYLKVEQKKYRFRILNASNARFFRLLFAGKEGRPSLNFTVIGSDANYIPRPVRVSRLLVAPSEVFDVVINFSETTSDELLLANDAPYPYPSGDHVDETNGVVMKFIVEEKHGKELKDSSRVPDKLVRYYAKPTVHRAAATRYITMYEYESSTGEPTHLFLNGKSYEDPVTETPRSGTSEVWHIINLTEDNHPLHIHLGAFIVLEQKELKELDEFKECMMKKNDALGCGVKKKSTYGRKTAVPRHERGWKNVFKIRPGYVTRILVRFALLRPGMRYPFDAAAEPGYVYHCHILDHEDNEMMRPLKLKAY